MTLEEQIFLKGKRIGAVDYGLKRIGFAVCDELHITTSPRGVLQNTPDIWDNLLAAFAHERLGAVIVGVPYRVDGATTPFIETIEKFIVELRVRSGLLIIAVDESFSSRHAMQSMVASGVKKKQRAQKGRTDEVAAALILRDFLEELR